MVAWGKSFESEMSSSVHIDNEKRYLVLVEGPTQELNDTILTAEAIYPIKVNTTK